jgi:hypothetical protein
MLGAITAGGIVVLLVLTALFWRTLFGPGTWGSGGNLVAWVICGGMAFGWTWLLQHERHLQALTLAVQHHKAQLAQAQAHHDQLMAHVTAMAADGPVSGGAGSNPAEAGLPADGPVVPPPAAWEGPKIIPVRTHAGGGEGM